MVRRVHALALFAALSATLPTRAQVVSPAAALTLDQAPPVPVALRSATAPYLESRSARVQGWNPATRCERDVWRC
jgi:hypothetical protein